MAFKMNGFNAGEGTGSALKKTYKQAYEDRDMKTYGNLSLSEYTTEAKRQNVKKEETGSWDYKNAPKKGNQTAEQIKAAADAKKAAEDAANKNKPKEKTKVGKWLKKNFGKGRKVKLKGSGKGELG